jgi:hypothetical protein
MCGHAGPRDYSVQQLGVPRGIWPGPPSIRSYEPGETRVAAVAQDMEARKAFLADVRYRLKQAQVSQKLHYDW